MQGLTAGGGDGTEKGATAEPQHAPGVLLHDSIIIMNKAGWVFLRDAETVCTAKSEEHQSVKSEKRS